MSLKHTSSWLIILFDDDTARLYENISLYFSLINFTLIFSAYFVLGRVVVALVTRTKFFTRSFLTKTKRKSLGKMRNPKIRAQCLFDNRIKKRTNISKGRNNFYKSLEDVLRAVFRTQSNSFRCKK